MSSTADVYLVISGEVIDSVSESESFKKLMNEFPPSSKRSNEKKDIVFEYEEGEYSNIFDLIEDCVEGLSQNHYYIEYAWWGNRGDTECMGELSTDLHDNYYCTIHNKKGK